MTRPLPFAGLATDPSASPLSSAALNAALALLLDIGGDASTNLVTLLRTAAQSRTLAQHLGDTLSVLDFVEASDNGDIGLAIQRAHNAANPGDRLFLPGSVTSYTMLTGATFTTSVSFVSHATVLVSGAITAFTLAADGCHLEGLTLLGATAGTVVANSTGLSVSGNYCLVKNVRVEQLDNLIVQPLGCGDFCTFRDLRLKNAGSRAVWIADGVGTTIDTAVYDTNGSWNGPGVSFAPPSVGGLIYEAQGGQFINLDFLHCGGLGCCVIMPYAGTGGHGNYWTFFVLCEFDQGVNAPGIHIDNPTPASGTGSYPLNGIFFSGCWSSSHQRGVLIEGTGPIDAVIFDGCYLLNNQEEAYSIKAGNNILLENCQILGNATGADIWAGTVYSQTPPAAPTLTLDTGGLVQVTGGRIAATGTSLAGNPTTHISMLSGQGTAYLDAFSIDKNTSTGQVITTQAAAGNLQLGRIIGFATKQKGLATAAAGAASVTFAHGLDLTPQPQEIDVTKLSPLSGATDWYLDPTSITATQATIRIVGTSTAAIEFGWDAEIILR